MEQKHEFALFVAGLSFLVENIREGDELVITDETLYHRMVHVLRLSVDESCIFFDAVVHVYCIIGQYSGKKQIHGIISIKQNNTPLFPKITFLLPFLKRDDYETALYDLAAVGINTIQLITTQKTHSSSWTIKDEERAQRILISAAEQSKNFVFPELKAPVFLASAIKGSSAHKKIFFDPQGQGIITILTAFSQEKDQEIVLLVGPEGDLTQEEKKLVQENYFILSALTPTILRAVQAASLGAGIVRSFF